MRTVREAGGTLAVDLGTDEGCRFFYGPLPEAASAALFTGLLRPSETLAVVGAGVGLTAIGFGRALRAANGVASGVVHVFEPHIGLRELLERNARQQGLTSLVQVHATMLAGPAEGPDAAGETLDACLGARGVTRLDALHVGASVDAAAVLDGAAGLLGAAPDPLLRLDLDADASAGCVSERLVAVVRSLEAGGFVVYAVDAAGVPAVGWPSTALGDAAMSLLLVRSGGDRERMLAARLPHATTEGVRAPHHGPPAPGAAQTPSLPNAMPLITALAVSRLRELDAITSLMSVQLAPPGRNAADLSTREVAAAWEQAMQRDDDMFTLQSEIERLLKESDTRLQEARQFRQEAKALRARYEVVAGQRLRDAGAQVRGLLARLAARRGAPKRKR